MANRERGEVEVVVNDKPYTLRLTTNAICELQGRTKKSYGQLVGEIVGMDFVSLREVVWSLLKAHHGTEFVRVDQVGTWMDDAGGVGQLTKVMGDLLTLNKQPKVDGEGAENPLSAQGETDGTGANSTNAPAVSG